MSAKSVLSGVEFVVVKAAMTFVPDPDCVASIAGFGPATTMQWIGFTNVIYDVQAATHLPGNWTTLGRARNTTTNFSFTNRNNGRQQFYRLAVP